MYCSKCGAQIDDDAVICPKCGVATGVKKTNKDDRWLTTLLLNLFLGYLGAHRFYTGHTAIGVAQLLTGGGCGIWAIVDLILILTDKYTDSEGRPLR